MVGYIVYMQIATAGLAMNFWSMLPDTVEYGEWRTGLRAESMVFGLGQPFVKAFLGVGASVFAISLELVGFIPNAPQSEETLQGLRHIMILLPAAGLTCGLIAVWFYPLKRGVHKDIVVQLDERNAAVP